MVARPRDQLICTKTSPVCDDLLLSLPRSASTPVALQRDFQSMEIMFFLASDAAGACRVDARTEPLRSLQQ
jgi:hypothetical protein